MTSLLGQQLGEYIMRSELGRGSMGIVYRATHVSQGTDFAVKVLLEALGSDESFVIRFNQEADVVRYLHHPNIIRVFERGKDADWLYFVMEYYPGAPRANCSSNRSGSHPSTSWTSRARQPTR